MNPTGYEPVLFLSLALISGIGAAIYKEECQVWRNVTNMLNQPKSDIEMTCSVNQYCLGMDCNSKYKYAGPLSYINFEEDYCFGVAIHPCNHPVDMHFYIMQPDDTTAFQQNLQSGESVPIPGAVYSLGMKDYQAQAYVSVEMKNTTRHGHPYLFMGITLKVKITTLLGLAIWPPGLERTLMPDMEIPIPPCEKKEDPKAPAQCLILNGTIPTPSGTIPPSNVKNCAPNQVDSCSSNEICIPFMNSTTTGTCVCAKNTVYNATSKSCVLIPTLNPTDIVWIDDKVFDVKKSTVHVFVIVGCVFSIVFLIGLGVGLVFLKYRRYRARYGRHSLLVNADNDDDRVASRLPDDDDDEPLDLTGDGSLQIDT